MLSAEPPSITTPKRMKITDHFPIQNNENSMEERVARMAAKDRLPLSVFVISSDLRDLFKAKGHFLPRSSTSIRMMIMNYGMTLRMKVLHELSELKETDHRFSFTSDEWTSSSNRRYLNINVHTYANDPVLFWNLGVTRIFGNTDIVAIATDTASVMDKTGTLTSAFQQLCYAHGLQLGILDVIYKKKNGHESIQQGQIDVLLENPEAETNNDGDKSNITDDDRFIVEVSSSSEIERELISDFNDIINKVREIVRLFKGSPTKNDMLQEYVKKEIGRKIKLDRDYKTGWSSLATMIETLKLCIAKTLIDLGVEVLCRQDANLNIAEATLKFMIKKLKDNHSELQN
ncbi:hypothetical protein ILUMI_17659 [Ignelater luminosus]|uniref:Uncharacterized protein n=1 Tax=Ignelater luminosus TaxID=2038154 RepID=A0A8K0CLB6_IGNLU|nr:hypothetical protein ILUMI_17659 [Ignelater luminosus]